MLTTKKKISVTILSFFSLLFLFSAIFLLVVKPFGGNPVEYTFRFNEQEVFAKDNSLIARGILRGVERNDEMVTLKVEMWNYTNNKYTIENISFPTKYLVNADKVYGYEFDNSYPIVDVKFNFNRFGKSDSKRIRNWFVDRKNPLIGIKNVEVVDRVEELESKISVKKDYMSENIKNLLKKVYNTEKPDDTPHDMSDMVGYLKSDFENKKSLKSTTFPFLRKALGYEEKYYLPENYYKNVISEIALASKEYTSLDGYLNTNLLDIDSSKELWSDMDKLYEVTYLVGFSRRLSEYLWFVSSYHLENSLDCGQKENIQICKGLVDLYTYNKHILAREVFKGGYGVCSATFALPELVTLTKDEGLKRDLDMIIENKEKLYSSCTFSGGGNGLCARDLKESVNCGLLLAKSGDTEMIKNFVLDRYAFFDEIDYDIFTENNDEAYTFTSKSPLYTEIDGEHGKSVYYLVKHLEDVKFLRVLSLLNM